MNAGELEGLARLALFVITSFIEGVEYVYKKLLAPGVTCLNRRLGELWNVLRSQDWDLTEGSVQWASGAEKAFHWNAEIAYSYKVAGEFYAGYKQVQFGRERELNGYVGRYVTGTTLYVRYDHAMPGASVLLDRDQLPSTCGANANLAMCELDGLVSDDDCNGEQMS